MGPLGPTSYRVGYRLKTAKSVVCNVELPAEIVEAAILARSAFAIMVTPDGHVRSSLSGAISSTSRAEPIDQLIAQIVSVDSLRLEEITSADLSSLLQRLFRSVTLVQEAMRLLPDQHVQDIA
jgi:hypothetical protein